jgi:hypothetical protein
LDIAILLTPVVTQSLIRNMTRPVISSSRPHTIAGMSESDAATAQAEAR